MIARYYCRDFVVKRRKSYGSHRYSVTLTIRTIYLRNKGRTYQTLVQTFVSRNRYYSCALQGINEGINNIGIVSGLSFELHPAATVAFQKYRVIRIFDRSLYSSPQHPANVSPGPRNFWNPRKPIVTSIYTFFLRRVKKKRANSKSPAGGKKIRDPLRI